MPNLNQEIESLGRQRIYSQYEAHQKKENMSLPPLYKPLVKPIDHNKASLPNLIEIPHQIESEYTGRYLKFKTKYRNTYRPGLVKLKLEINENRCKV